MMRSSKRKIATAMTSSGCHKRKKATESGCNLLPEEMIMEVLLRLPVKSILRFRAVCRSWAALFSTDEFCSLHMATPKAAPPRLIFVSPTARSDSSSTTELYSCDPKDDDHLLFTLDDTACGSSMQLAMPAPCHGLSLLFDAAAPAYYICNAATRGAVARLPPPPHVVRDTSTGFGFDARARKYKVVRLIRGMPHDREKIWCEVCTHDEGGNGDSCWRPPTGGGIHFGLGRFVSNAVGNAAFYSIPPVFVNGFLHWLVQPSFFSSRRPRVAVVSFSVAEETFTSVGPPPFWTKESYPRTPFRAFEGPEIYPIGSLGEHLLEMDNQLCLVRDLRYNTCGGCSLEIWKLSDYSSGAWSLNHRVSFFGRVARELRQPQVVRVIGFTGNGGVSVNKMIIATSEHRIYDKYLKKVYTYDLSSQSLETILSVTETHPLLPQGVNPSSRFSLIQESLALVHKTVSLSTTTLPPS